MIIRYTEWILKWRYLIVGLSLLATLSLGMGMKNLQFSNDYRVFFSKDNPQLSAFENLQNTYTKNDNVLFVIAPKDKTVFSKQTLAAVKAITEQAWQIPYSIRVDSITNFQHTYAEQDELIVDDLVSDPASMSEQDLDYAKRVALNEPMLVNRLVSPNAAYTGVNVIVQMPGINLMAETPAVVSYARTMVTELSQSYPDVEIRLSGIMMMNNAFPEATKRDGMSLIPLAFLTITAMLLFLLRGLSGTFSTVVLVLFSIVAAMGTAGWAGINLTPPSAASPIIILTIAIAGAVHLLVTMLQEIHRGTIKHDAITESMRVNLMPIFLTSLTTMLGFLSLNFSDAPPFRDLGNISAFGVVMSFLLTVTFLPAIMYMLPIKARHFVIGTRSMHLLGDWVVSKRKALLWIMGIMVVLLLSLIPKNELNDVFVSYFDESVDFRQDTDFTTKHLTGTYNIDYSLDSGEENAVTNPDFLKKISSFTDWYRAQPEVIHVSSISDTFKRLNKNMHWDDDNWYKLPETRELAAQYLLLYELSLPYGLDLNNQIDIAKQATRVSVILDTISSNQILKLEQRARQWLEKNAADLVTDGASPTIMFSHIGRRNIESMLTGTTIALLLISGILIIALRSFKYGLISLIPHLFPAGCAFGLWALFVGEVGLALSVVTAMTLGIVVDDTIHFISKYIRAREEKNLNSHDAVRFAFQNVGVALWVTSAVLVSGFMILSLSAFQLNSGMGMMTSMIITIALILDLFLLPTLLIYIDKPDPQDSHT